MRLRLRLRHIILYNTYKRLTTKHRQSEDKVGFIKNCPAQSSPVVSANQAVKIYRRYSQLHPRPLCCVSYYSLVSNPNSFDDFLYYIKVYHFLWSDLVLINRINRPLTGLYPCLLIADKIKHLPEQNIANIAKLTNDEYNPVHTYTIYYNIIAIVISNIAEACVPLSVCMLISRAGSLSL